MLAKNTFEKLIVAQLAVDGLSTSTIEFFMHVRPLLEKGSSCTDMAKASCMTPRSSWYHLMILIQKDYIERKSHKCWKLKRELIKDPDLLMVSYMVS